MLKILEKISSQDEYDQPMIPFENFKLINIRRLAGRRMINGTRKIRLIKI